MAEDQAPLTFFEFCKQIFDDVDFAPHQEAYMKMIERIGDTWTAADINSANFGVESDMEALAEMRMRVLGLRHWR
jgi:hypothetical protein